MSSKKINKHGLDRYIPQSIRQQIRNEAGYGCVMCGSMFCDYEHIEPEFNDAHEHNPEHMTLLCGGCHHHVTGKRKSKKNVWKAKKNPFALTHGYVKEQLEPTEDSIILLGNSTVEMTKVVVEIHGKPILWFESPSEPDEPILVNAIFTNKNGEKIAFINRNQFTATIGQADIKSEGTRIEFRPKPREISLALNIEADKPISIERLDMFEKGTGLQILSDKSMQITQGKSTFVMSDSTISSCGTGFSLGGIPATRRVDFAPIKPLTLAYEIAKNPHKFIDVTGAHIGWLLGNFVINRQYEIVGVVSSQTDGSPVHDITGEYLGNLVVDSLRNMFSVEMPEPEYETYEPIWITPLSEKCKFIRNTKSTDISFRMFENIHHSQSINTVSRASQMAEIKTEWVDVNDTIRSGDKVTIDFEGFIDGVPFEGGTAKNFPIKIGSGRMIAGFEDGLIGLKAGDSINLETTFPDSYHAENLRGKAATFVTTIIKVERAA
ncbi:FKBP-type peptidyl-prolyl cis-trans isomerase [Vibrio harveyi]|uniref:FKBP-type peptidyl-prolyl cis-trans isomerase n=1 Tax=Vibrio harveyi TaxID=669 RepID=UPI00234CA4E5|nr:FKBP-type peptidyl-prolyl cis-trans isomerase [Vibrio harveyi]WCP84012.1 FKBP-type peptidyl-prolyl cis-trans isomerase [Vibrio harveyi]